MKSKLNQTKSATPSIAIVTFALKGHFGGIRRIEENIPKLKDKGWEVHIVVQKIDAARSRLFEAHVHRVWKLPLSETQRLRWFNWRASRYTKSRFSLVVGHQSVRNTDVLHVNNCWSAEAERVSNSAILELAKVRYQAETLKLGRFKYVIANSNLTASLVSKYHGVLPERIEVVYPGVDIERFTVADPDMSRAAKSEIGLPTEKVLIGLVTSGNFQKRGVDRLMQAIASLPTETRKRIAIAIVGNDGLADKYRAMQAELDVECTFLASRGNIQEVFNAVDISVLPARIEEFGLVVLEAMASGRPVLVNEWVGASELIPQEWRRFVSKDHDDPSCLASHIEELVESKELRERFGLAMRRVAEHHTWSVNSDENMRVYELALQAASVAPRR